MLTIEVGPGELREAAASAPDGAILRLGPGIHSGPLVIERTITIEGAGAIQGAGAERTILDAGGEGGVVAVATPRVLVTLRGITLRGGVAHRGGAIALTQAAGVLVEDCILSGNRAPGYGGGAIYASAGQMLVVRSRIIDNEAGHGGAVLLDGPAEVRFRHVVLAGNAGECCGGLRVVDQAVAALVHCTIARNRARKEGWALHLQGTLFSTPRVSMSGCLVAGGPGEEAATNDPRHPGALRTSHSVLPEGARIGPAGPDVRFARVELLELGPGVLAPAPGSAAAGAGSPEALEEGEKDLLGRPIGAGARLDAGAVQSVDRG